VCPERTCPSLKMRKLSLAFICDTCCAELRFRQRSCNAKRRPNHNYRALQPPPGSDYRCRHNSYGRRAAAYLHAAAGAREVHLDCAEAVLRNLIDIFNKSFVVAEWDVGVLPTWAAGEAGVSSKSSDMN